MLRLPSTSRSYIRFPVAGRNDAGHAFDPTAATFEVAFTVLGSNDPLDSDWKPASSITEDGQVYCRVLVGPSEGGLYPSVPVAEGKWQLWGRFTIGLQKVVHPVDTLLVT